jgi:hypothetical protein
MPKFQNIAVWQQAEALMQPAFIRLIANISKQLEQSTWRGDYENVEVWAEGTSEETKTRVFLLRQQLESAPADQVERIEAALEQLPKPYPGYQLRLTRSEQRITVDLWEVCYQICFQDYDLLSGTSQGEGIEGEGVAIDASLFDETGDVDWNRLDEKAAQIVAQIFAKLPGQGQGIVEYSDDQHA